MRLATSPTRASRSPCPAAQAQTFADEWTAVLPTAAERGPRAGLERRHVRLRPDHGRARPVGPAPPGRPQRPQRRLRQPPVLRHRCVRVRPVLPAPGRGVLVDHERAGDPGRRHDQGHLLRRRRLGRQPAAADDPIKFNEQLDPTTINAMSVLLVGSGGDGIFGNGNDVPFNLSGRLSYANTASGSILTINMAGLNLPTDEYETDPRGHRVERHQEPAGQRTRRREHPQRRPERSAAGPPVGRRHPGRQLLPAVHPRHASPDAGPGVVPPRPVQRSRTSSATRSRRTTRRPSRARSPTSSRRRTRCRATRSSSTSSTRPPASGSRSARRRPTPPATSRSR